MKIELFSYLYGLFITDGNLSLQDRNRGKISLEISIKDEDLIYKLCSLIPDSHYSKRVRDTNFKENYESIIYTNFNSDFRNIFIKAGFPIENKTINANIPLTNYSERDFWRGVIDGDGSLGFTSEGIPFVSFVTKSEILKEKYCEFLYNNFNIIKRVNRNKRDNVYNIVVKNEQAIELANYLYNENDICYLNRKYQKAKEMNTWVRKSKKIDRKPNYSKEEIEYILTHSIEDSAKKLNRTVKAITIKKNRLLNNWK